MYFFAFRLMRRRFEFRVTAFRVCYEVWIRLKVFGNDGAGALTFHALQGVSGSIFQYGVTFVKVFRLLCERLWW